MRSNTRYQSNTAKLALVLILAATVLAACGSAPAVSLIGPQQYRQEFGSGTSHLLIDVRTPEEFASGHIPGAVNISLQTLPDRLDEIPTGQPLVVYCRTGNRSATAAEILILNGYNSVYDLGGIQSWIAQGYAVEYR
ncbi:MAG: rhodanese-like domain-containing protein [Anaerolineales bacterium]